MMWYGIMKEFNCKATSTWSKCERAKDTAFTHKHLSPEKEEETSQLDYIIGPRRRDDEVHSCNDVRMWAMWDHCSICARIQDEEQTKHFPKGERNKKWTGWKPRTTSKQSWTKTMTSLMKFWLLFRKLLRLPPAMWRMTPKQKEKHILSTPEGVKLREEAAARCTKKINRKVLKKQARKALADHLVKCCLEPGKKKAKRKQLAELYIERKFHIRLKRMAKGTAKAL